MHQLILKKLTEIEKQHNIKILLAVESGSRAWGFSSEDSDWDVRFIYVHKVPHYLSIQDHKDVIEVMDGDLDLSGWDLQKALKLLAKGNPPLLEWLGSPIVYKADYNFMADFQALAMDHFDPKAAIYHYLGMAKRNYKEYIEDKAYVKQKKYLYVIRPLLSCIYIQEQGKMAPTPIESSVGLIKENKAYSTIMTLITNKRAGLELGMGPTDAVLNQFIEETMFFFDLFVLDAKSAKTDYEALNNCLLRYIMDFSHAT